MKWYSHIQYVDLHTGEILTKNEVTQNYIITKKHKSYDIKNTWGPANSNGTRTREEYGIINWTFECTRNGKQLAFW